MSHRWRDRPPGHEDLRISAMNVPSADIPNGAHIQILMHAGMVKTHQANAAGAATIQFGYLIARLAKVWIASALLFVIIANNIGLALPVHHRRPAVCQQRRMCIGIRHAFLHAIERGGVCR